MIFRQKNVLLRGSVWQIDGIIVVPACAAGKISISAWDFVEMMEKRGNSMSSFLSKLCVVSLPHTGDASHHRLLRTSFEFRVFSPLTICWRVYLDTSPSSPSKREKSSEFTFWIFSFFREFTSSFFLSIHSTHSHSTSTTTANFHANFIRNPSFFPPHHHHSTSHIQHQNKKRKRWKTKSSPKRTHEMMTSDLIHVRKNQQQEWITRRFFK